MNVKEAAGLLLSTSEKVESMIAEGMELPKSKVRVKLRATNVGKTFDIEEAHLDEFLQKFEAEDPGRYCPVLVRRELLVEAGHHCAICRTAPVHEFHHMVDFTTLKHHDAQHMLALCGSCHAECTKKHIDYKSQKMYKAKLAGQASAIQPTDPHQEMRRNADRQTLRQLFARFPRPLVAFFLEQARCDQYHYPILDEVQAGEDYFTSATFHLHDATMWKLLKSFFREWYGIEEEAQYTFHDYQKIGVSVRRTWDDEHPDHDQRLELFRLHLAEADKHLRELNSYLCDQYPDLDLADLERTAVDRFRSEQEENRQKAAEHLKEVLAERDRREAAGASAEAKGRESQPSAPPADSGEAEARE